MSAHWRDTMQQLTVEIKETSFYCEQHPFLSPMHHLHKELEIICVREGHATAYVDNRSIDIKTGDLLIVYPNQIHYYEKSLTGTYLVLIFSADILFEMQSAFRNYRPVENLFHLGQNNFLAEVLNKLEAGPQRYHRTRQIGLLNYLMAELLSPVDVQPRSLFNDRTIKSILNYCELNYNKDISLHQMAQSLHLNKTYVSRIFNQKLHQNFKTYINTLRISRSCELLRDTELSISDISGEVGFGSFRTFNRAFFNVMNTTPSEYRKSLKYLV